MKKISLFLLGALVCTTLLSACNTQNKTSKEEASSTEVKQNLVGNDKDEHGCIASAGYVWSEAAQNCVRPWESDLKLEPVDANVMNKAFAFFSADSTQVEIMGLQESVLLQKTPDRNRWSNADESFLFFQAENAWVIVQDNAVTYVKKVL